jgi:hypothetical protein
MNFDCDPLTDLEFVYTRSQRDYCPHVFVARRPIFVKWQSTLNHSRRPTVDIVEVRGTDGDRINAHENFGFSRRRHSFPH